MASDKSEDSPDALLGDLESIRTLLHAEAAIQPEDASANVQIDDQVPLLEDVVAHIAVPSQGPGSDDATGGMDDALFEALLDDNWKESTTELLDRTRETIAEHGSQWTQQDTEDLTAALRDRINATLTGWLRGVVQQNMADLKAQLLEVTQAELAASVTRLLDDDSGSGEETAGSGEKDG